MTAVEDAHARAAELSRWEPVRTAWAAIHATAWNDGVERGITKPKWALAYAQRLKRFAESMSAAGLVDRVDLMKHSAGDDDQKCAWGLVQMALTEKVRLLASKIEGLPASCNWETTFNEVLPSSFVTGVISRGGPSPDRLRIEYVRDLRKAVKPLADGSNRIVKIAPKYLDAWAEIERVCRKRFGSSSTLAAINKLTSEVAERFDMRIHFVDAMDLNSFWAKLKECEATDVHETETRGGAADDDNVATRASSDVVESQTAGQITVTPVDDGGLAKYQDGQTPLGKRIVKALMSRKHFVKFATLRSEAWEGSEVEDSTIRRRLQDVEKRLTANGNHDVDIEISPVSIEAKWVWLNPQKGDKKGAN